MRSCTLSVADAARHPHLALPRLELLFVDGTSTWLHQVDAGGAPDLYVREVEDGGQRRAFDLRRLAPDLEQRLPNATRADQASITFLTLSRQYRTADDFLRAVRERAS